MFKLLSAAAILAYALAPSGARAQSPQPIELKMHHVGGPGSLFSETADEFARRVNERLNGVAIVVPYPKSALGSDTAVLKKLLTGEVELALVGTPMSAVSDEFGVFEMPFLVRDRDHIRRFRDKLLHGYLSPAARQKGYVALGMWELGFRHITNNLRPIEVPADLNGVKLRIPASPWREKMFKAYGVKTYTIELKDVIPGFQTGEIDGQENPLAQIAGLSIQKHQKYLSITNHVYTPAFFVAGTESFAKWPEEVRSVLASVGREMQDWALDRGAEIDNELQAKMAADVTINEADRFAFTIQSLPIYQEYVRDVPRGKALIRLIFESDPSALPSASAPLASAPAARSAPPAIQPAAAPPAASQGAQMQQTQLAPLPARRDGWQPQSSRQN